MISTATTAVSMADFSSAIRMISLKATYLCTVPKLLVISTAVPIGVGVLCLLQLDFQLQLLCLYTSFMGSTAFIIMLHVFIACSVQLGSRVFLPAVLVCKLDSFKPCTLHILNLISLSRMSAIEQPCDQFQSLAHIVH